jgi:hypothetical protein
VQARGTHFATSGMAAIFKVRNRTQADAGRSIRPAVTDARVKPERVAIKQGLPIYSP